MSIRYSILIACICLTQVGCTSMSSTMLTRDESNSFWTRKGNLKGVPITLKVPTHVQLTIFEKHFLVNKTDPISNKKYVERLKLKYVVRDFAQEFIYTEKIFTVDFKRPAAGMYNLNLNLTDDQYIQELQHDVTDNTIQNVNTLVGQLLPNSSGLSAIASAAVVPEDEWEEIRSVVATGVFEVEAPDFEQQMCAFINCHLNQAHDAWVAPPEVKQLNRVGLTGFTAPSDICRGDLTPQPQPPHPLLPQATMPGGVLLRQ